MNYPNYPYQNNYQNPYLNAQAISNAMNTNPIIWVQGESGAKAYPVAPGNSIALFDSEKDRFFIKTADASGMPSPLRVFNYTEQTANVQTNTIQELPDEYVTRKEFEEFVEKMSHKSQYVRKEKSNGKPLIQRDAE